MNNLPKTIFIVIAMIISVTFIWVCSDTVNPIESQPKTHNELGKVDEKAHCCNNTFPSAGYTVNTSSGFINCGAHDPCETTVPYCAHLWSQEVTTKTGTLGSGYCKDDCPEYPPPPDDCAVERVGNTAYISWDFVYSHYYLVYKKVNTGPWTLLDTRDNCLSSCSSNNMTDDVSGETNIYYKVKSKNYTTASSTYSSTGFIN